MKLETDQVYVCPPMRGVKWIGVKGQLAPRFVGPYRVLEQMREVAYKFELLEGLSGVQDVFHVSQLRSAMQRWPIFPCKDA